MVGILEECFRCSAPVVAEGEARAQSYDHGALRERDGVGHRLHEPLRKGDHVGTLGEVLDEDRELVAADARDGVGRSSRLPQAVCHGTQHRVTVAVAVAVVDVLEVVDVEIHDRRRW